MVVSLSGKQMYMWRAVDGEGEVLEILVQPRRDKADVRDDLPRLQLVNVSMPFREMNGAA
jgi:putative transposase